jgi:hypothetical protein
MTPMTRPEPFEISAVPGALPRHCRVKPGNDIKRPGNDKKVV